MTTLEKILNIIFDCIFELVNDNIRFPIINEFIVLYDNYDSCKKTDLFLFNELLRLQKLTENKKVIELLEDGINIYSKNIH